MNNVWISPYEQREWTYAMWLRFLNVSCVLFIIKLHKHTYSYIEYIGGSTNYRMWGLVFQGHYLLQYILFLHMTTVAKKG